MILVTVPTVFILDIIPVPTGHSTDQTLDSILGPTLDDLECFTGVSQIYRHLPLLEKQPLAFQTLGPVALICLVDDFVEFAATTPLVSVLNTSGISQLF